MVKQVRELVIRVVKQVIELGILPSFESNLMRALWQVLLSMASTSFLVNPISYRGDFLVIIEGIFRNNFLI